MATSASKKSLMPRGCRPSSAPSSAPVSRRSPSLVNSPISTAVSRTLEDQKANAVCRMGDGSSVTLIAVEGNSLISAPGEADFGPGLSGASRTCSLRLLQDRQELFHRRREHFVLSVDRGQLPEELRILELDRCKRLLGDFLADGPLRHD